MEALLSIIYFGVFALLISKLSFFKDETIAPRLFILVFLIKFLSSCIQKYLYDKYNFGGDTITLFNSGNYVHSLLNENPFLFFKTIFGMLTENDIKQHFPTALLWTNDDLFYNDNQTIIRINALLHFITFGSYYANALFFCFFSTVGFAGLFKFFTTFFTVHKPILFAIICFIPSALFWCANSSKESWLIFCLGGFLYSLSKLMEHFLLRRMLTVCLYFVLLLFIKVYFLFALIPALIGFFISKKTNKLNPLIIYIAVYLIAFAGFVSLSSFDFINYLQFKQHSFQYLAEWANSNSVIAIADIGNSYSLILFNIPVALWNILSRPYFWEIKSALWVPASIENTLIFVFILAGIVFFKWNKEKVAISLFCIFFSLSLLILIGLTTPVIGGLVRYRAPLLPFFLMFFLFHFDFEKFKKKLRINI